MITWQQVKDAVEKAGIERIDHHDCGICGEMVFYSVYDGQLFFNSACGCSWSPPEPRSWQSAADWINMQDRVGKYGDTGAKVAALFGMELPPVEPETKNESS